MKTPGPGMLEFVRGVRKHGFLDFVGQQWREHGDVFQVRLAHKTLVFAMHPDSVERTSISKKQSYDKLASYDGVRRFLIGDGVVASTGEFWRKQRKLLAPFYTPKGVQAYAELMIRDGEKLVERWQQLAATGAEVDIGQEMTQVTASIILKAMFSTETSESITEMKENVEAMLAFVAARATIPGPPLWVPTAMNQRYKAARDRTNRFIAQVIAQRRALDEARWPDDLLSRLMKARDEETGAPMSESLLRDESVTIFFAGHETTARTMTFTWYSLASNPEVLKRLQEELDRVLGGRLPTFESLRELPYTLRVIKEVLRLYPAAPFYVRDAVEADQLQGYDVPKGAGVMLSPYFTHRHPDFWENPDVFDPERWTKEKELERHSHAYHPFAAGPRICLGNNFSLLESHLLLAILARRFEPALSPGYVPKWEMQGTLHLANGLPMKIRSRPSRT